MSEETLKTFWRAVEALNRGDVESLLKDVDPEVEWRMAIQELIGGGAGVYYGHEGVRQYVRDMDEAFEEVVLDYTEARDLGDRILGTGSFRTRGRNSGVVVESPVAVLIDTDAEGNATKVVTYLEPGQAFKDAGLSE
jgi:ketosteroid isomerase-like protein